MPSAGAPSGRKNSAVASFCSSVAFGANAYIWAPPEAIEEVAGFAAELPFTW